MSRILIIDDERLSRFAIREILEKAGHEVTEAGNGDEGIALQKVQLFELVITDIAMPEKEGIETIINLKDGFPFLNIIGISGSGQIYDMDFLAMAEQFGADKVLTKPFSEADLLECVESCLNG